MSLERQLFSVIRKNPSPRKLSELKDIPDHFVKQMIGRLEELRSKYLDLKEDERSTKMRQALETNSNSIFTGFITFCRDVFKKKIKTMDTGLRKAYKEIMSSDDDEMIKTANDTLVRFKNC